MLILLIVTLFLQVFLQIESLYIGETCSLEGERGSCIPLSECQAVVDMVRNAGRPMPLHIRKKLQQVTCGFEQNESMVCCVSNSEPTTRPSWPKPDNSDSKEFSPWHHEHGDDSHTSPPWSHNSQESKPWTYPQDSHERLTSQPWTPSHHSHGMGLPTLPSWTPDNNSPTHESFNFIDSNENPTTEPQYTTKAPENRNGPPDVESHRNLRLLPRNNCGTIEGDRIWGGNRTRLFEMPWMVLLSYDAGRLGQKLSCGGALINEWYVLTAAHCVTFLGKNLRLDGVILGEYDIRQDPDCEISDGQEYCAPRKRNVSIASALAHPGYTPQTLVDDIALIRLDEPADFTKDNMKPICLPITRELQEETLAGKNGVVAGWGVTEDGLQSPVLLSVDLPILTKQQCQEAYKKSPIIHDTQLCAGGIKDKDSCGGDSGGPIMYPGKYLKSGVRYIQRGIVSYGPKRCGIGGVPGVYTNVAHYMKWILDNMSS